MFEQFFGGYNIMQTQSYSHNVSGIQLYMGRKIQP